MYGTNFAQMGQAQEDHTSTEENKAVVRRFADAFTRQDHAALNQVLAPELAREVIEEWFPGNDAL